MARIHFSTALLRSLLKSDLRHEVFMSGNFLAVEEQQEVQSLENKEVQTNEAKETTAKNWSFWVAAGFRTKGQRSLTQTSRHDNCMNGHALTKHTQYVLRIGLVQPGVPDIPFQFDH